MNYQNLSEEEKDKRQKDVRERFRNPHEEEKEKKHQYHHELDKNLSEKQKKKQVKYMWYYYLTHKSNCLVA